MNLFKTVSIHTRARTHIHSQEDEIFSSICVSCRNRRGMAHWLKTESSLGSTSSTSYSSWKSIQIIWPLRQIENSERKKIDGSALVLNNNMRIMQCWCLVSFWRFGRFYQNKSLRRVPLNEWGKSIVIYFIMFSIDGSRTFLSG